LDAPAHFLAEMPNAQPTFGDRVDLRQFCGTCAVIPIPQSAGTTAGGVSPEITPRMIEDREAVNGRISPGEIVLLHCGWDRDYVEGPAGRQYVDDVLVTKEQPGWPAIRWLDPRSLGDMRRVRFNHQTTDSSTA
jgi:kynurenine formamidase